MNYDNPSSARNWAAELTEWPLVTKEDGDTFIKLLECLAGGQIVLDKNEEVGKDGSVRS